MTDSRFNWESVHNNDKRDHDSKGDGGTREDKSEPEKSGELKIDSPTVVSA